MPGFVDSIIAKVNELSKEGGDLSQRLALLTKNLQEYARKIDNITRAIEDGSSNPGSLTQRLTQLEAEKRTAEDEYRQLESRLKQEKRKFTADEIRVAIDKACRELEQASNRQLQVLIGNLIAEGWFVPHMRFDNKKFILRCWIRLNFVALLPDEMRDLHVIHGAYGKMESMSKWICVDLSENSFSEDFLNQYHELRKQGFGGPTICRHLNVPRTTGQKQYAYYEQYLATGLDNAFTPMFEAPSSMSRYRFSPATKELKGKSIEDLDTLVTDPTAKYLITS